MPELNDEIREQKRIKNLRTYEILDTDTEKDFEDLSLLAITVCDAATALITFVDTDRQWFKSHQGLPMSETDISHSFCAHAIRTPDEMFIVEDATKDERFATNPLVTGFPNIVFYAGVPLVSPEGYALGSLCVLDMEAKKLTARQQSALKVIARCVMDKLELRRMETASKR